MQKDEKIIQGLLSGKAAKKYVGKQVVVIDGEVYTLPNDDQMAKDFFNNLIARHPETTPTLLFVPKQGAYILSFH